VVHNLPAAAQRSRSPEARGARHAPSTQKRAQGLERENGGVLSELTGKPPTLALLGTAAITRSGPASGMRKVAAGHPQRDESEGANQEQPGRRRRRRPVAGAAQKSDCPTLAHRNARSDHSMQEDDGSGPAPRHLHFVINAPSRQSQRKRPCT